MAALAGAGKHILTEKPLADTYADASRLVTACAKAGVTLAVNQNFRDHYAFGIAAELIAAGEIGSVLGVSQRDLMFRQDRGWRTQMERHALSVMGVHWFDGFRQLIDGAATRVSARTYSSPAIDCAGETDAFVQIDFGPVPVSYVQSFSSRVSATETIVFGDQGTLRFDYGTLTRATAGGTAEWANPYAGPGKPESTFRSIAGPRVSPAVGDPWIFGQRGVGIAFDGTRARALRCPGGQLSAWWRVGRFEDVTQPGVAMPAVPRTATLRSRRSFAPASSSSWRACRPAADR